MLMTRFSQILVKIWSETESKHPILLHTFASVCQAFSGSVEKEWKKVFEEWMRSLDLLLQPKVWREHTMSTVAKLFSRGPEYHVADILSTEYRFNPDIKYVLASMSTILLTLHAATRSRFC
jgi:hypothetical protein